jgi:hypothetical protein
MLINEVLETHRIAKVANKHEICKQYRFEEASRKAVGSLQCSSTQDKCMWKGKTHLEVKFRNQAVSQCWSEA